MKRICLLYCLLLLSLTSCALGTSPTPSPTPPPSIAGFAYYTSEVDKIEFQYPDHWVMCDLDDFADPDFQELIREQLSFSVDVLDLSGENTRIFIPDLADGPAPVFTLRIAAAEGFSQKLLLNDEFVDELTTLVADNFTDSFSEQCPDASLVWVDKPYVEQFGSCVFVVLSADISIGDVQQSVYQAMTASNDQAFLFTYSASSDGLNGEAVSTIETILSTVVLW